MCVVVVYVYAVVVEVVMVVVVVVVAVVGAAATVYCDQQCIRSMCSLYTAVGPTQSRDQPHYTIHKSRDQPHYVLHKSRDISYYHTFVSKIPNKNIRRGIRLGHVTLHISMLHNKTFIVCMYTYGKHQWRCLVGS